jgi:hypothetical protein
LAKRGTASNEPPGGWLQRLLRFFGTEGTMWRAHHGVWTRQALTNRSVESDSPSSVLRNPRSGEAGDYVDSERHAFNDPIGRKSHRFDCPSGPEKRCSSRPSGFDEARLRRLVGQMRRCLDCLSGLDGRSGWRSYRSDQACLKRVLGRQRQRLVCLSG